MAEITNSNVFDPTKRFIDLTGLELFWDKAKAYIDGVDTTLDGKITVVANRATALETTVNGTEAAQYADGLVKKVETLRADVNALGGTEGGIQGMIDATIEGLDLPNTYEQKGAADAVKSELTGVIEENEKTTAEALTDLDDRVKVFEGMNIETVESAAATKAELQGNIDALAGRVTTNEGAIAGLKTLVGETSVEAQIDAAFNDFSTKVSDDKVVNTYKELIDYAAEHGAEFTELVGVVGTKANAADVYTKTEANGLLDAKADKATTYTKTEVDDLLAPLAVAGNVYTKDEVDDIASGLQGKIDLKADAATAATKTELSGAVSDLEGKIAQALADAKADAATKLESYYTKDQVDTKLADYYTSAQVDTKLADYYTKDQVYTKSEVDGAFTTKLADYYTKSEVDGAVSNAQAADQAYARAYTDLLFNSVVFASTDEINGIF